MSRKMADSGQCEGVLLSGHMQYLCQRAAPSLRAALEVMVLSYYIPSTSSYLEPLLGMRGASELYLTLDY